MLAKDFISTIVMLGFKITDETNVFMFKNIRVHFTAEVDYKEIDLRNDSELHVPKNLMEQVIKFVENPNDYT